MECYRPAAGPASARRFSHLILNWLTDVSLGPQSLRPSGRSKIPRKNRSRGEAQIWFWVGRTTLHFNIRAVCDEGRGRLCLERLDEFFAVECLDVGFQFEGIGRPDFPPWMFDADLRLY